MAEFIDVGEPGGYAEHDPSPRGPGALTTAVANALTDAVATKSTAQNDPSRANRARVITSPPHSRPVPREPSLGVAALNGAGSQFESSCVDCCACAVCGGDAWSFAAVVAWN